MLKWLVGDDLIHDWDYLKSFSLNIARLSDDLPQLKRPRFLLCGQILEFLHRVLRRIISRESLLEENDWHALLGFRLHWCAVVVRFAFCGENRFPD